MMMWGTAVGIPLSALRSRLKGAPDPGSTLAYEIVTIVGSVVVTPLALLHALVSMLRLMPEEPEELRSGRGRRGSP